MTIRRARDRDLDDVRRLLWSAGHSFTSTGEEDLASLLAGGAAVVGEENGQLWGSVILQAEARPATLPVGDPARVYLRGVALRQRRSSVVDVPRLLGMAEGMLPPAEGSRQIIAYGVGDWLYQPLRQSGYTLVERVTFLRLENLHRRAFAPSSVQDLALKMAQPGDLAALATLDATAFDSIWHFDEKGLLTLLLSSVMVTAWWQRRLAGYVALVLQDDGEAFLARIAVDTRLQGNGIGRALLTHAAQHAQDAGAVRITLNTQTDNDASQALYRGFGFRPTGRTLPVFTKIVEPNLTVKT